ncbi:hypothetical protein KQX54_019177 [Cotesia glomerata]|uniref:Uncharacterized protein n=1 Tax=Cotesia glomerata TaxID=32391 RepID=A0AAV7IC99_COTGL|nr:hypothetical protein KQX54_019177 [Cotesia glomerata]
MSVLARGHSDPVFFSGYPEEVLSRNIKTKRISGYPLAASNPTESEIQMVRVNGIGVDSAPTYGHIPRTCEDETWVGMSEGTLNMQSKIRFKGPAVGREKSWAGRIQVKRCMRANPTPFRGFRG